MQTLPGGDGGGGKHRLLFPGQLLHFALNKSVDKIQQQPREQSPEPKKIPPSAVKALALQPLWRPLPLAPCPTLRQIKNHRSETLGTSRAEAAEVTVLHCNYFWGGVFVFCLSQAHAKSPAEVGREPSLQEVPWALSDPCLSLCSIHKRGNVNINRNTNQKAQVSAFDQI